MLKKSDLHVYQKTSATHIIDNPFCGLFLDMGLGKTVSSLTAIDTLMFEELAVGRVLIVAPKRVAETVWKDEIEKWEHLKHLKISRIMGDERKRKTALAQKADIYTIGVANFLWLMTQYGGAMLPFDMLVIDESSLFKNHKSKRFEALKKIQPCFKRVLILTGTPVPNGLLDLWPQMWLLDRGRRLGQTITFFRDNYFRKKYSGHGYDVNIDSEERIYNKIKDIVISMKAEDYLELPERFDTYLNIDLPSDVMKRYKDFEKEKVLEMFSEVTNVEDITAVSAGVLFGKLLQFAGGAIYDEEKNVHVMHTVKIEAAQEFVEAANGRPVMIAYTYQHECARLLEALKAYKPKKLNTEQDIRDWNCGKIDVMLIHPASGGHGLNLQEGYSSILWYTTNPSLELYQQLNTRIYRQGRKFPVNIAHLVCRGTVDERCLEIIQNKTTTQDALLQAVKAIYTEYKK